MLDFLRTVGKNFEQEFTDRPSRVFGLPI